MVVWLIIGAIAAGQRGYYGSAKTNCASFATIIVTILAGPLNYVGANPKVQCTSPATEQVARCGRLFTRLRNCVLRPSLGTATRT